MINTFKAVVEYAIEELNKTSVKYEVHEFPSGAAMLDVWIGDSFYVFQFEDDFIGFSEVKEEAISFDTIPDVKFNTNEEFEDKLRSLLEHVSK